MKTLACRLALLLALLLQVPVALALGLGQIEVKSRAGEPLLAEIPIISTDPSELENLQARLASPETFRRIGLEPPAGLVSELRFAIALDPRGRPVVRITSDTPVQQPLLTFLVEVDWGQGRLVREYSALVDTPQTVAAPAQPPIQAPEAAPSNVIVRTPPSPPQPAQDAAQDTAPAAEAESAAPVAETPPPAPAVAPAP
ncbi:type IV pilus assembly protein FimV, partial [Luteimonas sp. SDU101]